MAYILCLETTTTNCSVALSKSGQLIAIREQDSQGYSHAEQLHSFIQDVLQEAAIQIEDLSAIAVSKGPGSYTGLRIGVSAAKGLSYALNIPLLSVSTLALLAKQVTLKEKAIIITMLDARRMEAYTAVFDEQHQLLSTVEATVLTSNSFADFYTQNTAVYVIGNAVEKFKEILPTEEQEAFTFIPVKPSAKEMVQLVYDQYKIGDTEDVAYFEPYYLKDFKVTPKKN